MSTEFLTPVGRIVQGDCFKGNDKDFYGKPRVDKNGSPSVSYYIGLAIAKNDPGWGELWGKITTEARTGFPGMFDASGNCTHPAFAFKVIDGDSEAPNTRGVKWCDHEGFPGHYVLKFNSGFPPKCYTAGGGEVIVDPERIKRGYFVRIHGSIAPNNDQQKPGVYLNFDGVEFIGYGEAIITGPSGSEMFGASPVGVLPPGASATPVAGTPVSVQPQTPAPVNAPAPAYVQTTPAPAPIQPAHDFIPTGGGTPTPAAQAPFTGQPQPVATGGPQPSPVATVEVRYRTAEGGIYTHAELTGYGFTPDQINALPQV